MDQLKDIVKKFGGFIELGGFALALISVFLPFVVFVYGRESASATMRTHMKSACSFSLAVAGAALLLLYLHYHHQ